VQVPPSELLTLAGVDAGAAWPAPTGRAGASGPAAEEELDDLRRRIEAIEGMLSPAVVAELERLGGQASHAVAAHGAASGHEQVVEPTTGPRGHAPIERDAP
jgi:hypothetical protein